MREKSSSPHRPLIIGCHDPNVTIDILSSSGIQAAAGARVSGTALKAGPFTEVAAALAAEFPALSIDAIDRCVTNEAERLRQPRISTFLCLLVHKAARDQLRNLSDGTARQ